ncbi:MAG: hypothetical protein R3F56_12385 [Planctomycetota bacterium]
MSAHPVARADVFFLPLAVADPASLEALGFDTGVLSRRIPDFLHQLLNQGDPVPTGMLEVQSAADDHPVGWVEFREPPDPEEAFELLPEGQSARAVVLGALAAGGGDLRVELHVHLAEDIDAPSCTTVKASVSCDDPAPALLRLAERLARVLEVAMPPLPSGFLTRLGPAFFAFLGGLDGVALLSGELAIAPSVSAIDLLRPLARAVQLDPTFGLALRTWHLTIAMASDNGRLEREELGRLVDECLGARPGDGEACVSIAEHLSALGDHARAVSWLQHAVSLEPPPPRGLESLGIVLANRGETLAARDLWLAGLEQDGHPDFFAHLARLSFACGEIGEAWERVAFGLRRVHERSTRHEEWDDDGRGSGVMLAYLLDHLTERKAPLSVVRAVRSLAGVLRNGEDRIVLGLCLHEVGAPILARAELEAGLAGELSSEVRDRGVRALLRLRVRNFEARFAKAVDHAVRRQDPRRGLTDLERWRQLEPEFWLASFYVGIALRRLGDEEAALDTMAEVLRLRPGQPDVLTEMAALFDRRGNPKRALECIEDALSSRPGDTALLGRRALYQHRLGRRGQAVESLDAALGGGVPSEELEEIRRQILS